MPLIGIALITWLAIDDLSSESTSQVHSSRWRASPYDHQSHGLNQPYVIQHLGTSFATNHKTDLDTNSDELTDFKSHSDKVLWTDTESILTSERLGFDSFSRIL